VRRVNYLETPGSLATKLRDIEHQHQRMFDFAHQFFRAISSGASREFLLRILADLIESARINFASEELILKAISHPSYDVQSFAHQRIVDELILCSRTLSDNTAIADTTVVHAMDELLIHHVCDDLVFPRLANTMMLEEVSVLGQRPGAGANTRCQAQSRLLRFIVAGLIPH
jgi:hemerythrin-like metal-binding protein